MGASGEQGAGGAQRPARLAVHVSEPLDDAVASSPGRQCPASETIVAMTAIKKRLRARRARRRRVGARWERLAVVVIETSISAFFRRAGATRIRVADPLTFGSGSHTMGGFPEREHREERETGTRMTVLRGETMEGAIGVDPRIAPPRPRTGAHATPLGVGGPSRGLSSGWRP